MVATDKAARPCADCGVNPRRVRKNGELFSYCNSCTSARVVLSQQKNREAYNAYKRGYQAKIRLQSI